MTAVSVEQRRNDVFRTQSFFREINNRVAELSHDREASAPRFICECTRVGCGATVVLPLVEYAQVRADPACFIVLAGHEDAMRHDVVDRRGACVVVRHTATLSRRPRASTVQTDRRMSL